MACANSDLFRGYKSELATLRGQFEEFQNIRRHKRSNPIVTAGVCMRRRFARPDLTCSPPPDSNMTPHCHLVIDVPQCYCIGGICHQGGRGVIARGQGLPLKSQSQVLLDDSNSSRLVPCVLPGF